MASAKATYGRGGPVVEAARLLRNFQFPRDGTAPAVPLAGSVEFTHVGVLAALPTDEGLSWGPAAFLAVWTGAVLYVAVSGRFSRTTHYVGLKGTSKEYKFGSVLSAPQRAFVIAFLREQVFGN